MREGQRPLLISWSATRKVPKQITTPLKHIISQLWPRHAWVVLSTFTSLSTTSAYFTNFKHNSSIVMKATQTKPKITETHWDNTKHKPSYLSLLLVLSRLSNGRLVKQIPRLLSTRTYVLKLTVCQRWWHLSQITHSQSV